MGILGVNLSTVSPPMNRSRFSERFGLDRTYLADVEHGKRNISILNLEIIVRGFGLMLSRFLTKV
jgi:transcriptional regulator with XRE-family HTH domain